MPLQMKSCWVDLGFVYSCSQTSVPCPRSPDAACLHAASNHVNKTFVQVEIWKMQLDRPEISPPELWFKAICRKWFSYHFISKSWPVFLQGWIKLRCVTRSCKCYWPVLALNCWNIPYNKLQVLRGTTQQFLKSDLSDHLKLFWLVCHIKLGENSVWTKTTQPAEKLD